jgi:hypothetical protein
MYHRHHVSRPQGQANVMCFDLSSVFCRLPLPCFSLSFELLNTLWLLNILRLLDTRTDLLHTRQSLGFVFWNSSAVLSDAPQGSALQHFINAMNLSRYLQFADFKTARAIKSPDCYYLPQCNTDSVHHHCIQRLLLSDPRTPGGP